MAIEILDPTSEREPAELPLAPALGGAATIALLNINKPRGDVFLDELERLLAERGGFILPGVRETLDAIAALPDVRLGLATGNFRRAAAVKLRYFGLDHYFADGGFADDAEDRALLVRTAIERLGGGSPVLVIGDTAHDIMAARANGAVAVGVATGASTPEMLAAAGAAHVFNDLSRPEELLRVLRERESSAAATRERGA